MSQSAVQSNGLIPAHLHLIESAELNAIRDDLAALRRRVVTAWLERGVMLTSQERGQLREDIAETCEFLTDLTQSGD